MRISRRLAWILLLSAVATAAMLRQFHDRTPESQILPWPIRSLLFFLLVILFLVFLRGWGRRQELPYAGERLEQVNLLSLVPFLIAIVGEKWFSITFYAPVLAAGSRAGLPEPVLNALGVLLAGLGILVVAFALLPLFPRLRPLVREYLSARSLLLAVVGTVGVLGLLYGCMGAGLLAFGDREAFLLPRWYGSWAGIRFSGQALIALGEEIYYHGLLQSELIFLLPALGLRHSIGARIAGVGIIACQFALEHAGGSSAAEAISIFIYTAMVGAFLGTLLLTIRSIWLCALTHFALNLFAVGGGLQFTDAIGAPLFEQPMLYVALYLILLTLLVYSCFGPERQELARRKSLPAPG